MWFCLGETLRIILFIAVPRSEQSFYLPSEIVKTVLFSDLMRFNWSIAAIFEILEGFIELFLYFFLVKCHFPLLYYIKNFPDEISWFWIASYTKQISKSSTRHQISTIMVQTLNKWVFIVLHITCHFLFILRQDIFGKLNHSSDSSDFLQLSRFSNAGTVVIKYRSMGKRGVTIRRLKNLLDFH